MSCHGGSGASTLHRLTGLGSELGMAAWPAIPEDAPVTPVVLVCRATAKGLWSAFGAVSQWARTMELWHSTLHTHKLNLQGLRSMLAKGQTLSPRIHLLGVVVVAASSRRPPRIVQERMRLLDGRVPWVRRIGWVDALVAADDPRDVGMPPDVEALRAEIVQTLIRGSGQ